MWINDREKRAQGLPLAERALALYDVTRVPRWWERPEVTRLAGPARERLRGEASVLLMLVARALAFDAEAAPPRPDRQVLLRTALLRNEQAEACLPPGDVPAALWSQRAELLGKLGRREEAERRRAADLTPPKTARDHYLAGVEFAARSRYREALDELDLASSLEPKHYWACYVAGWCTRPWARTTWPSAVTRPARRSARPRRRRGTTARSCNCEQKYSRAEADLGQAIRLRPDSPTPTSTGRWPRSRRASSARPRTT